MLLPIVGTFAHAHAHAFAALMLLLMFFRVRVSRCILNSRWSSYFGRGEMHQR